MDRATREAMRRARSIREGFHTRAEFTQQEYKNTLYDDDELARIWNEQGCRGWLDTIAERIDKDAAPPSGDLEPQQKEMFPLLGEYRLGEQRRVAKRMATRNQFVDALHLNDANLDAVRKANERMHHELEVLRPFWRGDTTKAEAVAAYRAAHSEDDPAHDEQFTTV